MWAREKLTKIQTTSRLDGSWPEVRSKMSTQSQREANSNGIQSNPSWTLEEFIALLRMIRNSSPSSRTQEENGETNRESAMPCEAQRNSENKSTSRGDLVQKDSWTRPHAPKNRKNQIQFLLTKVRLTKLDDDAASTKR